MSVDAAVDEYELYLKEKGDQPQSIKLTRYRLRQFFAGELDTLLGLLSPRRCERLYDTLRARRVNVGKSNEGPIAVDTQRNTLAEARSFLAWCVAPRRWITRNPLAGVKGIGARHHGKEQLRLDEARGFYRTALKLAGAGAGDAGAVAALVAILLGLRASEITGLRARDVDDGGKLLWVSKSKTRAGERTVKVPDVLRELLAGLRKGKQPEELLFGRHWRDWPRENVQRICRLAKVPEVTAHGARGMFATTAFVGGEAAETVAAILGHEEISTTLESYAAPGAPEEAARGRFLKALDGGLKPARGRRTR